MSNSAYITTIIAVTVAMTGIILGVVYLITNEIGARFTRLEGRVDHLADRIDHLSEDVAVLKAAR